MKKRWSNIDEPRVRDLGATFKSRPTGDDDPIKPMRAAPFRSLLREMLPDDQGRFVSMFREAGLGRKKAVLTPPIKN